MAVAIGVQDTSVLIRIWVSTLPKVTPALPFSISDKVLRVILARIAKSSCVMFRRIRARRNRSPNRVTASSTSKGYSDFVRIILLAKLLSGYFATHLSIYSYY